MKTIYYCLLFVMAGRTWQTASASLNVTASSKTQFENTSTWNLPFNPEIFRFALEHKVYKPIDWSDFIGYGQSAVRGNYSHSVPRGIGKNGYWYGDNNNGNHGSKQGAARSGFTDSPLAGSGLAKTGWTNGGHWSRGR
jgi:hypothetical protein